MTSYIAYTLDDVQQIATQIALFVQAGDIICLYGDLGAGKTTFVKLFAHIYAGVSKEEVTSPTFQYLHIYNGHIPIFHFDLYRLKTSNEFVAMGFDDFLFQNGISCIEWPERIETLLPKSRINIYFSLQNDGSRKIQIQNLKDVYI